jgi:histone-arginine methyltransferase CARM1
MGQAVVGYFGKDVLISSDTASHVVDFQTVTLPQLQVFEVPLAFRITRTALLHGLGCWFDAHFVGSAHQVTLTTAPDQPGTHWYQCRLLLAEPLAVNASQTVTGNLRFVASSKISYTVTMTLQLDGTHIVSENKINLADQMYHYLQGSGAGAAASGGYDAQGNWTGGYTGQQQQQQPAAASGSTAAAAAASSPPPPPPSSRA